MKPDLQQALERFNRFLAGQDAARVFTHPTCHPSQPTGFCPCDRWLLPKLWFYLKATALVLTLKQPFNGPKVWLLRALGATIGRSVFISVDAWIDPAFPRLLAIEDEVMLGVGARIFTHEFRRDGFFAGRVILRKGSIIGGFALIGPGVEIGAGAVVAGGAVVGRDVPGGMMAVGNPARALPLKAGPEAGGDHA